ncbi:hypothetical protein Taro_009798, partial [Colocasia esculenta]|nr:hypothetical protein [Colocasia esculenta]
LNEHRTGQGPQGSEGPDEHRTGQAKQQESDLRPGCGHRQGHPPRRAPGGREVHPGDPEPDLLLPSVSSIAKRLNKTSNWTVSIKALVLVHRLIEGDPTYEQEIFFATRRGTRLLNMADFWDTSRSDSWDFSAVVRTFALYLDEHLEFPIPASTPPVVWLLLAGGSPPLFSTHRIEIVFSALSSGVPGKGDEDQTVKEVERLLGERRRAELEARIASGEFTVEQPSYISLLRKGLLSLGIFLIYGPY